MHLSALGEMAAKLHNFSSAWQPPEDFSRPKWDWDSQLGGSLFDVDRDGIVDFLVAVITAVILAVSGFCIGTHA